MGDRDDIKVVGDRFIFESELLFDSASADLQENGKAKFKSAKKGLDLDKLKNGEYTLEEILAPAPSFTGKRLGSYKNEDVLLKKGKFGLYIVCGSKKYSLKGVVRKKEDSIKLKDILYFPN